MLIRLLKNNEKYGRDEYFDKFRYYCRSKYCLFDYNFNSKVDSEGIFFILVTKKSVKFDLLRDQYERKMHFKV